MMKRKHSRTVLHAAKLILLAPLLLYLAFIIPERYGVWDRLSGLDLVDQVTNRFEQSVGPNDAIPIRTTENEFAPLINLIRRYSATELSREKTPHAVVRFQAKVYDSQPLGDGKLAQWSSLATPIAVMYYDWPKSRLPGGTIPTEQYAIVGTLGDLHEWIARSREDRHFLIVDLLLVGVVPILLGVYEYYVETPRPSASLSLTKSILQR